MMLERIAPIETKALKLMDLPIPEPRTGQILVEISTCGVCHTERARAKAII